MTASNSQQDKRYPGQILSYVAALLTLVPPLALITLIIGIVSLVKMKRAGVVGWQKKFLGWYSITLGSIELLFTILMLSSIFGGYACFENKTYSSSPVPEAITCQNNITILDFFDMLPGSGSL
jgi:Na+/H+-dicarboxylate symporter